MDYYTCQKCQKITRESDRLDEKPICGSCLDDLSGNRLCDQRGFHETYVVTSDLWEDNRDGTETYVFDLKCRCGVEARSKHVVPSITKIIAGINEMPEVPPKWTFIDGMFTALPADVRWRISR